MTPTLYTSRDDPSTLRDAYERDGFVILSDIFGKDLQEQEESIRELRDAARAATEHTRQGRWPYKRSVGKRYPPFDVDSHDYWGVQHILHPDCPHSDLFARLYGSSPLLDMSATLLGLDAASDFPREMQLELFNLLINPTEHHFALNWHRDDVRPEVTAEEEAALLQTETHGVQWNAALYDDECLFVVPETHRRVRTEAERRANQAQAPAPERLADASEQTLKQLDGTWDVDPPSALRVKLKAGQTVFYSQRILHRASYLPTKERATLHGCYGCVGGGSSGGGDAASGRARNVLQHGVEWMRAESFGAGLPARLRPMWRNLLAMDARHAGTQLGYSLEG